MLSREAQGPAPHRGAVLPGPEHGLRHSPGLGSHGFQRGGQPDVSAARVPAIRGMEAVPRAVCLDRAARGAGHPVRS